MKSTYTSATHKQIYTVIRLTSEIKSLLEDAYSIVWVTGEISNISKPVSGHVYFTLKDERAQISSVIFRNQYKRLLFSPENGMQVTGLGRVSVYEPRGTYQVIFEHLEPKGVGALQVAFEQLKAKLFDEGLFDDDQKKPIPLLPGKISIITSPTGSVVHDIIQIVCRRFPNVQLEVIPVKVQGGDAVQDIVSALSLLNQRKDADVAILARGGGSLEDLHAFNSEDVARAIFASGIPVISAVGHETDFTIADFVSDLRAPTPSAAAELVVPKYQDLAKTIEVQRNRLKISMQQHVSHVRHELTRLSDKIADPGKRLQDTRLRIDDLSNAMNRSMVREIRNKRENLKLCTRHLQAVTPYIALKNAKEKLNINTNSMYKLLYKTVESNRFKLQGLYGKLNALSPVAVLERGYGIVRTLPDHHVVTDSKRVAIGENLEVMLSKGALTCIVEGKTTDAA